MTDKEYVLHTGFVKLMREKYGEDRRNWPPQTQLAQEIGLAQGTISSWMNDKVDRFDRRVLVAICKHFECEVGDLLYIEEVA